MSLAGWFQDRLPISGDGIAELTNEPVPYHLKRWWFALGGTPAYLFVVQIVTGILLAFYYEPSPATAYESVRYITEEAAFGWYLRSLHKWAATLMIAAVILHQMRVYFTGAYRKPREINWMVGMCLLLATLMTGFTGYSLVYEQLSYWGATVGANIADTVPVVGPAGQADAARRRRPTTATRCRASSSCTRPCCRCVVLLLLGDAHVAIIRLQGVTELRLRATPSRGRTEVTSTSSPTT